MADADPARAYHRGPTVLADIADLASPDQAPRTIRFSAANDRIFQTQRAMSYPGGHSREQGGTIVADAHGHLAVQNIGGLASTAGTFSPDLVAKQPAKFTVVGFLHTHPYDRSEGSFNGVSFSGGDVAYQITNKLTISVVQSRPRVFALLLTGRAPATVDFTKVNDDENAAIQARVAAGGTFQQSSRIGAEAMAAQYGLAYYQGHRGVLTRVSPR